MESDPDNAKGFHKGDRAKQDQLWSELGNLLNASRPPIRDVVDWKKTWCEWRRSIKTRSAENKSSTKNTGGDFQELYLLPIEERLAIVCDITHAVDGIPKAKTYGGINKCKESDYEQEIAQLSYIHILFIFEQLVLFSILVCSPTLVTLK